MRLTIALTLVLSACGFESSVEEGEAVVGPDASGTQSPDPTDPSPLECGCTNGTQCGPDRQCVIAPDSREDNDTLAEAKSLGVLYDADDPSLWIDDLSIDATTDEDWFRFRVIDDFDAGNPDTTVRLVDRDLGPLAAAHELTVWFKCDSTETGSRARCGTAENTLVDPALGVGCTIDGVAAVATIAPGCSATADSGTVTLRVRKRTRPLGDTYDLHVTVQ